MANTAQAQEIFKSMTPEQQQAFLNKEKTASAGDQTKVTNALKPQSAPTPAPTPTPAPIPTGTPAPTPTPAPDNVGAPTAPTPTNQDKVKAAWEKMNMQQQQEFTNRNQFDPAKYGLVIKKADKPVTADTPTPGQTAQTPTTTPTPSDNQSTVQGQATSPAIDYQDNSTERLATIRNNLDQQAQVSPSLFNSRQAFDANFNYALRSDAQKAVLNDFWYQKSQSDVFNNTPTGVLANQIATGQTSIDSFSFMKDKDPVKYAALQSAVTEANSKETIKASLDPAKFLEEFNRRHDEAIARIDTQESTIDTASLIPAITQGKSDLAGLKSEIDQIELDKAKIKSDVLSEYEGKGISKSLLNEIVNDRQQTLTDQGNDKILQYNSKLGTVNAQMDQMKMFNDLETDRRTEEMSYLDRTMNTMQTMLGIQQNMDTLGLQQDKLNFDIQQATSKTDKPLIQDFGTTKSPQWKQSFDNGKTWQSIEGIGSGASSGGGGSGPSKTAGSSLAQDIATRLDRLTASLKASPLPLSTALSIPQNKADLDYINSHLSLISAAEAKKAGVTFGSMTEGERALIQKGQLSLNPFVGKEYAITELNRVRGNQGVPGGDTNINPPPKTSILGGDPSKSRLKK